MPTAAKLVVALVFAIAGHLTAGGVRENLPEGMPANQLWLWPIVIPIICAWRILGNGVGKGMVNSINVGSYAMVAAVFFTTLVFAVAEMIKLSTRLRYDGPMDAIVNMFGIAVDYGTLLLTPGCLIPIVCGALLGGVLGELAFRRWP